MNSYFCLVINLLSVLDNYGAYGQDNALEEEEDLTRYYKEDCYKPPLFGSNAYDPVKEIFHPLKHSKQEKDPALGNRGSSEGLGGSEGSTIHEGTSTSHTPGGGNEDGKKTDPESYLRQSVKHQLVTLSHEPEYFKHYTKLVTTTEDSAYFRHSSKILNTPEKPASHLRHSNTTHIEDISNTTKSKRSSSRNRKKSTSTTSLSRNKL